MRWDANNINAVNEMIGTLAHTDLVQEADRALELEEHAHHRVILVGLHIDENPPHAKTFHIEMPTNLDHETIAGISIKVAWKYFISISVSLPNAYFSCCFSSMQRNSSPFMGK
jgi:hypothetical protein